MKITVGILLFWLSVASGQTLSLKECLQMAGARSPQVIQAQLETRPEPPPTFRLAEFLSFVWVTPTRGTVQFEDERNTIPAIFNSMTEWMSYLTGSFKNDARKMQAREELVVGTHARKAGIRIAHPDGMHA